MEYLISHLSDVGIRKETNQDSCCIHLAETNKGKILMAVLCDGMGGLSKGEVASGTLIRRFSEWFCNELPCLLSAADPISEIRYSLDRILKTQNQTIGEYGSKLHLQLGSTVSMLLILEDGKYIIAHVGDSRIYQITDEEISVLTEDQTVVANEIKLGRMTPEQAKTDPRRNVLLQCVGASRTVLPDFLTGQVQRNTCYMLCSDGFRHEVSSDEIRKSFAPSSNGSESEMKAHIAELIELNKYRHETDNITAVLLKTV